MRNNNKGGGSKQSFDQHRDGQKMTLSQKIIAGGLMCLVMVLPVQVIAASPVYTIGKIKVDATAQNAVKAKKKALSKGPTLALEALLKRLTHYNSYDRLPKFSDAMAEDLTDNVSILKERNSSVRYIALLKYQFQAKRIRRLLLSKNIPLYDQKMSLTTIIPVYKAGPYRKDAKLWSDAWRPLDTKHSLTPVRLTQPPADNDPVIERLLSGQKAALQSLYSKYNTDHLIVAFAEPDAEGKHLIFQLVGRDAIGEIDLKRKFLIFNDDVQTITEMAAKITLGILEGRWKEAKMLDIPLASKNVSTISSSADGNAPNSMSRRSLFLTIPFRGLRDWQTIRKKLNNIPGLEDMDVKSLSARSAFVHVEFPGGKRRLERMASRYNMQLEDRNGELFLHAR